MSDMQRPTSSPPQSPPWVDTLLRDLRAAAPTPPVSPWVKWLPFITTILGVALTGVVGFAGAAYWKSGDRIDTIERTASSNKATIERDADDRSVRRAQIDERIKSMVDQVAKIPELTYRLGQNEGAITALADRTIKGFDVARERSEKSAAEISDIRGDLKAIRQSLDTLNRSVERMEARNRGTPPFLENPTWRGPTPPSLKARLFAEIANGRL